TSQGSFFRQSCKERVKFCNDAEDDPATCGTSGESGCWKRGRSIADGRQEGEIACAFSSPRWGSTDFTVFSADVGIADRGVYCRTCAGGPIVVVNEAKAIRRGRSPMRSSSTTAAGPTRWVMSFPKLM